MAGTGPITAKSVFGIVKNFRLLDPRRIVAGSAMKSGRDGDGARDPALEAVQRGDRARDARDWAAAAKQYRDALDRDPEWPEIWVQYGHAMKESGQFEQAEKAYRRALTIAADNADAYVQLGHVLKLQQRTGRAGEAYLQALRLHPALHLAREELARLGWSTSAINQGLLNDGAVSGGIEAAALGGVVLAVGTDYVEGRLEHVGYDDLPLTLICSNGESVIAEMTIERPDAVRASEFPAAIPFRLEIRDFASVAAGHALRLLLEPGAIELRNSPFLPPGRGGADLLSRVEQLESRLAGSLDQDEAMRNFATKLSKDLYESAVTRIDAVIEHQRRTFERQLLRLVGGMPRAAPEALSDRLELSADDEFPGYGWFPPETSAAGERHRWICERGFVTCRLAGSDDLLLLVDLHEAMMGHLPDGLSVTANGVPVRRWVQRHHPSGWRLTAIVAGGLRHADGTIGIAISSDEAVLASTRDPRRLSVSLSRMRLRPLPSAATGGDILVDPGSDLLVHGWLGQTELPGGVPVNRPAARATVLLPRIETRYRARLTAWLVATRAAHPESAPKLTLNGLGLDAESGPAETKWCICAAIEPASWRVEGCNLLELASPAGVREAVWALQSLRLQLSV